MQTMGQFTVYETRNEYNNRQRNNTSSIILSENALIHPNGQEILCCRVNENEPFLNCMKNAMEKFNIYTENTKLLNRNLPKDDEIMKNLRKSV